MNELKRLETIIAKDVSFLKESKCKLPKEVLEDFKIALRDETEKVKNRIICEVCKAQKKAMMKQYIQHHQQNLIELSSHLLKYTHPERITKPSDKAEIPALCHYLYKSIEELLTFFERHFTGYFNCDAWVPTSYRIIAVHEVREDVEALEQSFIGLNIDVKLTEVIFLAFREFLDQELSNDITYRKVKYLKALATELQKIVHVQGKEGDITELIKQLLISLNYNSACYLTYCTNEIMKEVNAKQSQVEKLERLSLSLKEINQVRDRHGFIYDVRYRPLKEQIANWIAEELNFQEKTYQLTIFPDSNNPVEVKLDLDLSVAHVACLLRGLIECGVIKNKNLIEVMKLFAGIIATKRTDRISAESLRMRYYNIEHSAKMAIISKLRMIADHLAKS